jgi:hypothetical protein
MPLTQRCPAITIQSMREWSLGKDAPLSLCIAADARMCTPDYKDDQIWELSLQAGDPPALALQTTYGLRAIQMRIFPGFLHGPRSVTDPAHFAAPPLVRQFFPNYLKVECRPFEELLVEAEYWVPESHAVVGRFTLMNTGAQEEQFRLRLYGLLRPGENPMVLAESYMEGALVLTGRSGPLNPVIFMAGGAVSDQAAYPSLGLPVHLVAGESHSVVWAHSGLGARQASFAAARALARCAWDAEIARLELANAGLIDIETGDVEWDVALAMAQKVTLGSFLGPTRALPHPSFVLTRSPDRGYSVRGDGVDYGLQWNGQMGLHAYLSALNLLPIAPQLSKGILRNYIHVQELNGTIDGKPGMAGQRCGTLCIPLLCTLAWKAFQHTEDLAFLEEVFPGLYSFLDVWFSEQHDRDADCFPEWDTPQQAGFDEWPTFARWGASGQGLDISKAETPDLASYLYAECQALLCMARQLGREGLLPLLEERCLRLAGGVEASWSQARHTYQHIDRDMHVSPQGGKLGRGKGAFRLTIDETFDQPLRVLLRINGPEEKAHNCRVSIRGRGKRGRSGTEKIAPRRFQWFWDHGTATSEKTYHKIEWVEVEGLAKKYATEVWAADYTREDQSLLLPLWAGIPDADRAAELVTDTLLDAQRYWRPYGIPNISVKDAAFHPGPQGAGSVGMIWNTMLGEGLVNYGYCHEAAELLSRLMQSAISSLRQDKAFFEAYHPDALRGIGERNHLCGVAPLHLFLHVLGVRLISPRKVWIAGRSPFPGPVTVRWRGLEILRQEDHTQLTFPDGHVVQSEGEEARLVEQRG